MSGSIDLEVDNVDEVWESLDTRAHVVHPIETMEGGVGEFEFGLLDDNGYQWPFPSTSRRAEPRRYFFFPSLSNCET